MPAVLDLDLAVPTGTQVYPARLHGAACSMLEGNETAHAAQHKPFSVGPLIEASSGQTRWRVGWLGSAELEATIARFFAQPERRSMGNETAVGAVCARHPYETIVVVAHGTVITLFISRLTGQEPFPLWKRLGLPSFIVLSLPDHTVRTIRDDLEAG